MDVRDALITASTAFATGLIGFLGAIFTKRTSSTSETQDALNDSFKTFMAASNSRIKAVEDDHKNCEKRVTALKNYINMLIKVLRQHGIPIPFITEDVLLEDRSFHEGNGVPKTPP